MQAGELFHAVTAAFPRSFKPREEWRGTFIEEVEDWAEHERVDAYKALKRSKSAAAAISLEDLRRARPGQGPVAPSVAVTHYTLAWLAYMRANHLLETCKKMGNDVEVYTRRLVGVLWTTQPGSWQAELDLIAGTQGEAEDKLWRLYECAKRNRLCLTHDSEGWKLPERP